jgi:hypothetical protein
MFFSFFVVVFFLRDSFGVRARGFLGRRIEMFLESVSGQVSKKRRSKEKQKTLEWTGTSHLI